MQTLREVTSPDADSAEEMLQTNDEMRHLEEKAVKNELRARDAEARLRIIRAEIEIIEKRKLLRDMKA